MRRLLPSPDLWSMILSSSQSKIPILSQDSVVNRSRSKVKWCCVVPLKPLDRGVLTAQRLSHLDAARLARNLVLMQDNLSGWIVIHYQSFYHWRATTSSDSGLPRRNTVAVRNGLKNLRRCTWHRFLPLLIAHPEIACSVYLFLPETTTIYIQLTSK